MGPKVGDTVCLVPGKGNQFHECEAVVLAVDLKKATAKIRFWVRVAIGDKDIGWFSSDEVIYDV